MRTIPEVEQILIEIKNIHSKKNEDYSADTNPFENFDRSSEILSWFENNAHKSFVWPISTKLARLATLLNSKKEPNNESIEDSFLDLATYCILWWAFYKRRFSNVSSAIPSDKDLFKDRSNQSTRPTHVCEHCKTTFSLNPVTLNTGFGQTLYFGSYSCLLQWARTKT